MREIIERFVRDESGTTAVEYALIGALVGIGIVGALQSLGTSLTELLQGVAGYLMDLSA